MKRLLLLLCFLVALAGCTAQQPVVGIVDQAAANDPAAPVPEEADDDFLDDSAFDEASPFSETPIPDPLEGWNRMWFAVNDVLWMDIFKPVSSGYEAVVHEDIRSGLSNAFNNVQAPIRIVNSLLQLEFGQATVEFGRFLINSTFGGLGLLDLVPAEKALVPINLASADFGGTLAKWGMGEGFYIVWPVIGPSSLRDSVGLGGDTLSSPGLWAAKPIGPVSPWVTYPTSGILRFNKMGGMLSGYETLTKAAVEPYTSLRDAYIKLRRNALLRPEKAW